MADGTEGAVEPTVPVSPSLATPTQVTETEVSQALLPPDYYWSAGQFTYSIPGAQSTWVGYEPGKEFAVGYQPLSADEAVRFRAAIALIDSYIAPSFTETNDQTSPGNLRVAFTEHPDLKGAWGYAYYPPYQGGAAGAQSGDIWIDASNRGFEKGSYNWEAMLHEIGHATGMKHSFSDPALPAAFENRRYTVMSYTDQTDRLQFVFTKSANGNLGLDFKAVNPASMMVVDIAAMQIRYGADLTTATGDNVYTFDQSAAFFETIYDAGGNDTIDVSSFTRSSTIDLTPGGYSSLGYWSEASQAAYYEGLYPGYGDYIPRNFAERTGQVWTWTDNVGIAFATVIENATGGSGDDLLVGNTADNALKGGAGNDWLEGGAGRDVLTGGFGLNNLYGGSGDDFADYTGRTDALWVDLANGYFSVSDAWDTFNSIEGVMGGSGVDQLWGTAGADRLYGNGGDDALIGRDGADDLRGGAGNDWVNGGEGDDLLSGGGGVNTLYGDAGSDTADYAARTDALWFDLSKGFASTADSWDTLISIENLIGGAGSDTLIGDAGANVLQGRGGNDYLIGGEGADRLVGGAGDDQFSGGTFGDVFDLTGGGLDTAQDFAWWQGDRVSLGGATFAALTVADFNGDGSLDSQLTWSGGTFLALGISGLSLADWNGLIV